MTCIRIMETQHIPIATDRRKERQGDELSGSLASPISNAMWDIHQDIIAVTNNNCGNSKSVTVEDLCDRPSGIQTPRLWVIQMAGSEGRSSIRFSLKWLSFLFLKGEQRRTEGSWHGAIHSTFSHQHTNAAQHLSVSANWNMPSCCWGVQICGCVHVPLVIHSIRMLQHSHAVHCQRCPPCDLGHPWNLHYHINYIHVVAAAEDWWYCYGFYTLDAHWKQWK